MAVDKESVLKAIKELREKGKKRNFSQNFDLILNFKDLDLKKQEQQLDFFMAYPTKTGKQIKVCALIGGEMIDDAKVSCDGYVQLEEFDKYVQDKKLAKKLADQYDFFIAQANLMTKIAAAFGRTFGPRGKMPNPKAGCVVAPKTPLKPLVDKLKNTIRISVKTSPILQLGVGKDNLKDEDIAGNVVEIYKQILAHLPNGVSNIRNTFLKMTMSAPVKL